MVLLPTVMLAGAVPTSWAAELVATAGMTAAVPPFPDGTAPDSAASGNRGPGACSITAAYRAGSTYITDSTLPEDVDAASTSATAVETTPGTEETWLCNAGGIA